MTQHTHLSAVESVRISMRHVLDGLLATGLRQANSDAAFSEVYRLLEALPLGEAEFGLAVKRLVNAHSYHRSGEYGAAQFELRILQSKLLQ